MQQPDSTADQLGQFHEKVCISESNAAANREVLGRLQEELLIIQRLHKVLRPFLLRRTKEQGPYGASSFDCHVLFCSEESEGRGRLGVFGYGKTPKPSTFV